MRPLLAVALVLLILGSVWGYLAFVSNVPLTTYDTASREAEGVFTVEVTLTFDAALDAFTVDPKASPLEVRLRGRNLIEGRDPFRGGVPIVISPVEGIVEGHGNQAGRNDFTIYAVPKPPEQDDFAVDAAAAPQLAHAVRVRILRDGQPVADQTIWSDPGQPVQGNITLTVEPRSASSAHADE
jgi:hypothetical protein